MRGVDSRDCRSPVIGGRHRAYMLGTWRESEVGVCRVHDSVADSVHQFGLLPSGDWSPRVTDVLRRIDHVNIFLLIAGTYTRFRLRRGTVLAQCDHHIDVACTAIAIVIHVIWINAPRWLYTVVYIIFGIYGLAYMVMFWNSPYAGPAVVVLLCAGGACYILGAIVYALRKPDPWPPRLRIPLRSSTAAPSPATPATWSRSTW